MKTRCAPFSGFTYCLGTACLSLLFTHMSVSSGSSHSLCQLKLQLLMQWDPKSGHPDTTLGYKAAYGGSVLHKLGEKETLILLWDIHCCTTEFQKLIPSVYAHHSVPGIIDRILIYMLNTMHLQYWCDIAGIFLSFTTSSRNKEYFMLAPALFVRCCPYSSQ